MDGMRMSAVLSFLIIVAWAAGATAQPAQPAPSAPRVEISGSPGSGAWVSAVPQSPRGEPASWSIPQGERSLSLEGVPPGLAVVCAGRDGAATVCQRLVLAEGQVTAIAPPVPGVRVVGRLLAGRRPISGAKIAVTLHPLAFRRAFAVPLKREGERVTTLVTSDEEGRFAFGELAPGSYRLILNLPGGRSTEGEPFQVPSPEELRRTRKAPPGATPTDPPVLDLGALSQPEGVSLEVTIVDRAGKPIPRAGAAVRQGSATSPASPLFEVWAGDDGKARLEGLDPALAPLYATCVARGYVRWQKTFDSLPPALGCELTRLSGIAGQTVDENGKPVAGVGVSVRMEDFATTTGKEGRFTLAGLPPGEHRLLFSAPGWSAVEKTVILADEEQHQLEPVTLSPARPWQGKVVDDATGEPIAGAGITVIEPRGSGAASTDEEGFFSVAADVASGGEVRIEISAPGYPRAPFAVDAEERRAGAAEPPVFRLRPGGRIHVSVWDEEVEAPCLGCEISSGNHLPIPRMVTDADGEALSDLLAPGEYRVVLVKAVSLGGTVQVSGGDNVRMAKVEPGRTAEVSFGERRARVDVVFVPEPPAGWKLWLNAPGRTQTYDRASDGRFRIHKGSHEALSLGLESPDHQLFAHQVDLPADQDSPFVRLPLPSTEVRGTVKRGDEPVIGQAVQLRSLSDGRPVARGKTDIGGSFGLPFVPPGTYLLAVDGQPLQTVRVETGRATDLGTIEALR